MRKLGLAIVMIAAVWSSACTSPESPRASRIPGVNVPKSPQNRRTYQADYDTVFRASIDALRQIDNSSAKLVKYSTGHIVFNKPNDTGTVTVSVKKVDEQTTQVELLAKNKRKYWLDRRDEKTRDAFFAELDEQFASTSAEGSETDASQPEQLGPSDSRAYPQKEVQENKTRLLAKIAQELQLGDEGRSLDQLSYADLSLLDQKLQALKPASAEKEQLINKCAACYIDLARVYHDGGRYARSAEALKIAITVDPGNAVAHCNLGEIYKHLRLFDDAIRELTEAQRLNPELPDTYINLGIIYDDFLTDDQKALEYYKKYLKLGGADKQVLDWIDAIEKGP